MRFLLLAFFLPQLSIAANLNGLEAKIDAFVKAREPVVDSGIAIGVIEKGQLVFFKGYGYRDRAKKLPVTADTLFAIGSITKSFTGLSLAVLNDEGRIDLGAPVRKLLPDFVLHDPRVAAEATFVDLLSHRTGLPRHDAVWYLTPFTSEELYGRLAYLELDQHEGMGFRGALQYNNLMYMTLGLAVERATGISWEKFVRARLLEKLGMNATQFSVADSQRAADFAQPYAGDVQLPFKALPSVAPAGAMNSSVNEMARYVAFFEKGGVNGNGERLVSAAMWPRLFEKNTEAEVPAVGVKFHYGLGLMLNEVAGRAVYWHGGNIDGFSAHFSVMESEGLGLVILTNQNVASAFEYPWKLVKGGQEQTLLPYLIYEHLLADQGRGLGQTDAAGLEQELAALGEVRLPFERSYRLLAGGTSFNHNGYGTISLHEAEGKYLLNYYHTLIPLEATDDPDQFFTPPIGGERWKIRFERAGTVVTAVSVPFEPAVRPIRFSL